MNVNVLGTDYEITDYDYKDNTDFEKYGADGLCDGVLKKISVCRPKTHPAYKAESEDYCDTVYSKILL